MGLNNVTHNIIKSTTHDPRKNLPFYSSYKRGELSFLRAFERNLKNIHSVKGFFGRNFSVPGYGIADFVWLRSKSSSFYLTAFELKLKEWKRALKQAYLYSYFADHSVVVLPPEIERVSKLNIELFRKLGIGLWIFDPLKNTIRKIHRPTNTKALNSSARDKAFNLFRRSPNFSQFHKRANSLFHSL